MTAMTGVTASVTDRASRMFSGFFAFFFVV
jgi:hypothetical protein